MATVTEKAKRVFGPASAGTLMRPREFDRAEFAGGDRYELIHGVLVVSPPPLENERDPNGELEYLLRLYRDTHAEGAALDKTLAEHTVRTKENRRRADRVIWAGLGRRPRRQDTPTLVVEFVSAGKRDRTRDSEEKRKEYLAIGVKEYWIFDRFRSTLTVYARRAGRVRQQVFQEKATYTTDLLPGFELPLRQLFALADDWPEGDED
jgi:Uma2 family endonuclease